MAGGVVTELPPFLAANAIREGTLIALLPDHPLPEQQIRNGTGVSLWPSSNLFLQRLNR